MSSAPKPLTRTQILAELAENCGMSRDQIKMVLDELSKLIAAGLNGPGAFTLPGLLKITVKHKEATPERQGKNPFTGEEMTISAKPARKVVRVTALKGLKDMV